MVSEISTSDAPKAALRASRPKNARGERSGSDLCSNIGHCTFQCIWSPNIYLCGCCLLIIIISRDWQVVNNKHLYWYHLAMKCETLAHRWFEDSISRDYCFLQRLLVVTGIDKVGLFGDRTARCLVCIVVLIKQTSICKGGALRKSAYHYIIVFL